MMHCAWMLQERLCCKQRRSIKRHCKTFELMFAERRMLWQIFFTVWTKSSKIKCWWSKLNKIGSKL